MNKLRFYGPFVAGTLALSGCTDPGYLTGEDTAMTRNGAAIGAAVGAFSGWLAGDDREDVLVGAAIGAGAGAIYGNILDKQAAELEQELGEDVTITNTGSELVVTMPQDILFATDSDALTGTLTTDLQTLAASMQRYPDTTIDVIGHADSDGAAEYNQNLSARRANAVSVVLLDQGVAPGRVRAFGRGEDEPIATNLTEEGKAQNRRVEVVIRPTS